MDQLHKFRMNRTGQNFGFHLDVNLSIYGQEANEIAVIKTPVQRIKGQSVFGDSLRVNSQCIVFIMSSTFKISGDNYISTSNIYVGVNSNSQVVVDGVKTVGFVTFGFRLTQ